MPTEGRRRIVAVDIVSEVFGVRLSDAARRLYAEALAPWPIEAVEGAMLEVARTYPGLPPPVVWGEEAATWWRAHLDPDGRLALRQLCDEGWERPTTTEPTPW